MDGSERNAEDLGNLWRRVTSPVAKNDSGSTLERQAQDGVENIAVSDGVFVAPLGRRGLGGLEWLQPALAPGKVDGLVEDDA
jgi:hypothetical protein